jgi:hypothetical protein
MPRQIVSLLFRKPVNRYGANGALIKERMWLEEV